LIRYGFDDIGLDRIIAQTMTANTSSRAMMERVGLAYVRTFPTTSTAMTPEQWESRNDE
jgi:RimJ/RimL family protein N-acetyltransferase